MTDRQTPDLLPPWEVAKMLGISTRTLTRWSGEGRIPVIVLPTGHRRFRREDVAALLRTTADTERAS